MNDWLVVDQAGGVVFWTADGRDEIMCETRLAPAFIRECAAFLPADPRRQAEVDVPRMAVWLDREPAPSLEWLEARVPAADHPIVWCLCTQIVWAGAYECASVGLPADFVVAEAAPAQPAVMQLVTDRRGNVVALEGRKKMRAVNPGSGASLPTLLRLTIDQPLRYVRVSASRRHCFGAPSANNGQPAEPEREPAGPDRPVPAVRGADPPPYQRAVDAAGAAPTDAGPRHAAAG